MKIIKELTNLILFSSIVSCNHVQTTETKREYSSISFTKTKIEIGEVKLGTSKEVSFYAVNKSETPLIIDSVKSSCSCTVSRFPKKPILKNDSGLILATYTPNKTNIGNLEKSIVVLANTKPAFTVLTFTGKVLAN
jgi:hypothetical protein